MSIFNKKSNKDIICCNESSYLIWRWHSNDSKKDGGIRWGSSLRAREGEVAIFFYKQEDGKLVDYIEGPAEQSLEISNLPVLARILGFTTDSSRFQAEIYFINLARIIQIQFGVPYFDVFDPRYPNFGVPLAVRGTVSFRISDYMEFIALHRLTNFNLDDFKRQIRDMISRYVKDNIAEVISKSDTPLIQIESKISQINELIEEDIKGKLEESFGVFVQSIDIGAIELDKSSDGYRHLMKITRDIEEATITAETEAKINDIADKQRINSEDYEENLRIQRKEKEFSQTKQTPPPIPMVDYYVVINNKAAGPYDIKTLQQMAINNEFNMDSLVWSVGMPQWVKAKEVEEVRSMLEALPSLPPI
ncbi:MAG: SPFH domain-containing protein [Erysipelotrichaceae bacterium]|nr:SPFH domain-containing protein [Erysipelotrichaceae bacterium]